MANDLCFVTMSNVTKIQLIFLILIIMRIQKYQIPANGII